MNNEREEIGDLLADVLRDEPFRAFDEQLKRRALGEFRRARAIRQTVRFSAVAITLAALLGVSLLVRHRAGVSVAGLTPAAPDLPPALVAEAPVENGGAVKVKTINNEELLALFPPGSCFIAEVDGKAMLVFRSEELRRK